MALRQIMSFHRTLEKPSNLVPGFASFSSKPNPFASFSSKPNPYIVKVGIPEFLNGVGKGVETYVEKLETEIGDFQKLLFSRTLKLKKLGIPCKHRKLILKYAHKYRLGLWRPRAQPVES
ncbi:uncharacterized protein LOC132299573 isoform X1 [Cornus florida]|uniref:uncharacterized protein LOC132299573 isoform X1 n=1 Tax=Cornus florida TaxID=4283 RepID=UPI0028A0A46B|nr:uncharacterized protein LOC132299573 isoform X1 [Cornus florida]